MENLNPNCFWSWIHKFHDTWHFWRFVSEDDCRAFSSQCWWEQQNSKVTCGPCWGQGTQNSSWKYSSSWASTGARRGVFRAPQNTMLAPRLPLCMCFTGVSYQPAKKAIWCFFVNHLLYYLGFIQNSLTTAHLCWEWQGNKLLPSSLLKGSNRMYHERALRIKKTTSLTKFSGSISFSLQAPFFVVS